eukprot:TRINITY_DN21791_c0_g1_i1.p1 TRINITY_DN21791_c0_g1~~TRINITY_DN21791_c0_g1_i1.p1  ORF type:complete len:382 (-),score=-20.58 TRINITY_DN21791_c0_g1_i1:84-1082(-)
MDRLPQKRKTRDAPNTAIDPIQYKTYPCKNWKSSSTCPYGPRCLFAHGATDQRTAQQNRASIQQAAVSRDPQSAFYSIGKFPSFVPLPLGMMEEMRSEAQLNNDTSSERRMQAPRRGHSRSPSPKRTKERSPSDDKQIELLRRLEQQKLHQELLVKPRITAVATNQNARIVVASGNPDVPGTIVPQRLYISNDEVAAMLRTLKIDPDTCNSCLRVAIQRGYIDLKGGVNTEVATVWCANCQISWPVTVQDLIHQPNVGTEYIAGTTLDRLPRCPEMGCHWYVTGLCQGRPRAVSGIYHNHCTDCPGLGECVYDYKLTFCKTCSRLHTAGPCY